MRFGPFRKWIALTALLTAVCLFPSCMGAENFVQTVFMSSDVRGAYVISPEDHRSAFDGAALLAEGGSLSCYYDERTGNVGLCDSARNAIWSALPVYPNRTAAVVTAEAFNGTATYELNSQDHAVAYGAVSAETGADSVTVTYVMADKEATVTKYPDGLKAGDVCVSVPVTYTFRNGRLTVSVDMADVVCAPGLILYSISVLPSFGAIDYANEPALPAVSIDETSAPETTAAETTAAASAVPANAPGADATTAALQETTAAAQETTVSPQEKTSAPAESDPFDFILLPAGCGAAAYTEDTSAPYPELDFCVYGSDDSLGRQAALGAFGIKKSNRAFVCVVTEGTELAVIRTLRRTDSPGEKPYTVYAQYQVTPVYNYNGEMAYGLMYTGTLSQTYSFVSGGDACCAGMAAAAREILIHAGTLSSAAVTEDVWPVNVALTGSVDGKKETLLTDYEQAEAVLSLLRAKGIEKVNLSLNGFLSGGLMSHSAASVSMLSSAGTGRQRDSLCDYAVKQGYDIYLGCDLLTAGSASAVSRDLSGKKRSFTEDNPFAGVGSAQYLKKYVGWSAVPENASGFLTAMEDTGFTGFTLSDLYRGLSADYTARAYDRSSVSAQLSEIAASFSTLKKLWVNGGNFNALKCADVITGVPFGTVVDETERYRAVPFVQMILHGSCVYSGTAVASASADRLSLLKTVEYGGVPYFSWVGSSRSDRCYEELLSAAAEFCARAGTELRGLAGARITGHYEVSIGLVCTTYDSGAKVYVNYNNYSAAVGQITVGPYDFVRIN